MARCGIRLPLNETIDNVEMFSAFVRQSARALKKYVKSKGGKPFTDREIKIELREGEIRFFHEYEEGYYQHPEDAPEEVQQEWMVSIGTMEAIDVEEKD